MNGTTTLQGAPASRWTTLTAPWRQRWQALALRERRIALGLAWAVGLLLLWFVAVAPAWQSVRLAPARLDELDKQIQPLLKS